MDISKSSGHSKITHDFGKALVMYWLSKHEFECDRIHNSGIDCVAYNPKNQEKMGIFIKSRCRNLGKEQEYVAILLDEIESAKQACNDLGYAPYVSLIIDADSVIRIFITTLEHLLELFPLGETRSSWKMTSSYLEEYSKDPQISIIEIQTTAQKWCLG